MDLHGQINAACESRPDHPQPRHWSVWIVLEWAFMLAIKWISVLATLCQFWQIQSQIWSTHHKFTIKMTLLM